MTHLYEMISGEDALIFAFAVCSTLFLLLSFSLLSLIILSKLRRTREGAVRGLHWPKAQEALALITVADASSSEYQQSVSSLDLLMKRSGKMPQWILDEIVKQQSNLAGESKSNLLQAYHTLKLKAYSLGKLKNKKWNVVASGIQELERMAQNDCESQIRKFSRARSKDLRKVARLALTSLAQKPLDFLKGVKEEINEWEQMSIRHRLRGKRKDELPDFSEYYYHAEPSVTKLCIGLSVHFNCFEHIPQLIWLLGEESEDLQVTIIEALNKLEAFQAIEAIEVLAMQTQNQQVMCAALGFLGNVGCSEGNTVIKHFIHHPEAELRMEAVEAAIKLELDFSALNSDLRKMYAHHQNRLIS